MKRRIAIVCALGLSALIQTAAASQTQPAGAVAAAVGAERSGEESTVTFANRPIVILRARVLGRSPAERALGAGRMLEDLVAQEISGPVESRSFDGGAMIVVASRGVLALTTPDIDELSGETLEGVTVQTVARLQQALDEAVEARSPGRLLVASALSVVGIVVGLLMLWGLFRARQKLATKLVDISERKLETSGIADAAGVRASRLLEFQRGLVTLVVSAMGLVVIYGTLTFVLRRFPYTRPWGESMRGFLLTTVEDLALAFVNAIPGLFSVALIFIITRYLVRLLGIWFRAIEQGRARSQFLHPDTAQPTRRLVTTLMWLFAVVVAYPYMPGSDSEAFRGVSVFLGLMVTFGSSGLVNQVMSGFMLTYSRALRKGDFVRIGDVEGTVIHLGVLSTKIRTLFGEEVTIPNAVVVGQTTTDYTRFAETGITFTQTSVTIGYDTPWRQVQAMLLLAAERTSGLRREPAPYVLQMGLQDFYVKYTLCVHLEQQESRLFTLHALHGHIQDLFNEYGVQIMSPNYLLNPKAPKLVAKKDWYAAPASPD
jgi:small-conductance mechanosensitive channel